jgi:hypothetical protein
MATFVITRFMVNTPTGRSCGPAVDFSLRRSVCHRVVNRPEQALMND